MRRTSRRDILRLAGGVGAASALAACTPKHHAAHIVSPPATATSATPPSPSPSPSPSASTSTPAAPDWSVLARQLQGRLLRPNDSGYSTAARLYNPRFDATARPTAIVVAASAQDVAATVRFAADARVPFVVRSGGHSYPGWSNSPGLVIDVAGLSGVTVDTANHVARIGPGARLANVYGTLAAKGVGIAAGSCPTVGLGGLAQGGGVGVLTRAWGLTCDSVRSIDVVTADGRLRTVDDRHDPDLFWALRGGGGGSFGAVTSFTLAVRATPTVTTYYLAWPYSVAAEVVSAWATWMPKTDRRLYSTCKVLADPPTGRRTPLIAGAWAGSAADLSAQLATLLAHLPTPSTKNIHAHTYADAMLIEAGCSGQSANTCVASGLASPKRQAFAATSSIVSTTLPAGAIAAAVAHTNAAMNVSGIFEGGVSFDSLGGAVRDLAADANAFGHRTALATVQYTATWNDASTSPARFDTYVRGFRAALAPWLGTAAYVNYADASITNFGTAYWGGNYPRLQSIKRAYDPHNLFTFAQAVRPALS